MHKRRISFALGAISRIVLPVLCAAPFGARANLFVSDGASTNGTIAEYSDSGLPLNPSLITGLSSVRDIAISGSELFVLSSTGRVGAYTTSGQTLNASLITGLNSVEAIAVSGNSIFIGTDVNQGTVAKYTTSGMLVNGSLITGFPSFHVLGDLAISGGNLFVSSSGLSGGIPQGTVGEYALTGAPINPPLITFSDGVASALAVSGSNIFVRNSVEEEESGVDTLAQYTTSGALVNASLITGLTRPFGIAVSDGSIFVAEAGLVEAGRVGKYTFSGEPIDASLITGLKFPSIAVSGQANGVPDSLSTLWLALPLAGLLAARFRRLTA